MVAASAAVVAIGFSQKTGLPTGMARSSRPMCLVFSAQMTKASTSLAARTASSEGSKRALFASA